jgi:signal transduction histidine kinase
MPERTRLRAAAAPDLVSSAPVSGPPACGSPLSRTDGYYSAPWVGAYAGSVLEKVAIWLRGHPRAADDLLAAVLLAFAVGQVVVGSAGTFERGLFLAVTVVLAATVALRRRHPVAAFGVAALIGAAQLAFGVQPGAPAPFFPLQPTNADLAIPVLLYTLAAHRPRRISIAALMVCLLGSAVAVVRWAPAHHAYAGGAVLGAAGILGGLTLTAWVLGDSVAYRYRHAHYAVVEARAAQMEAERDAQARIAAAAERARELQERRAVAVDQSAARLRRIERDLHDGTQVRLAALAMMLGEIKENLQQAQDAADGDGHVLKLVGAAHRNAKETLAELRDLARGIHPAVLDRGLAAALGALADTVALPVEVDVRTGERPSAAIEAIAYFCAAELLANMTKHSGASRGAISVSDGDGRVLMTVRDNGSGGAWPAPGGGLAGLRERVQTVDGRLSIDSPPGGPTSIMIELPGHA